MSQRRGDWSDWNVSSGEGVSHQCPACAATRCQEEWTLYNALDARIYKVCTQHPAADTRYLANLCASNQTNHNKQLQYELQYAQWTFWIRLGHQLGIHQNYLSVTINLSLMDGTGRYIRKLKKVAVALPRARCDEMVLMTKYESFAFETFFFSEVQLFTAYHH